MIDLVFLGGGGHAKSVLDSLYRMNAQNMKYNNIVVTDPDFKEGTYILDSLIYGDDSKLSKIYEEGCRNAFISVGSIKSTALRRKLSLLAERYNFNLVNIIDPSADVSDYSNISKGVFIGKQAVVNADAVVNKNAIINTGVVIEHECHIGEYSHIACGSILCGNVFVGDDSFIGAGTVVIEGVRIGNNAVIGAGSVVLRDVMDNEKLVGVIK